MKPKTIYAASRISGIRPTTLLYLHYLQIKHCGGVDESLLQRKQNELKKK